MNCKRCEAKITLENVVRQDHYKRKVCRNCYRKDTKIWNEKRKKKLKMWRNFYS